MFFCLLLYMHSFQLKTQYITYRNSTHTKTSSFPLCSWVLGPELWAKMKVCSDFKKDSYTPARHLCWQLSQVMWKLNTAIQRLVKLNWKSGSQNVWRCLPGDGANKEKSRGENWSTRTISSLLWRLFWWYFCFIGHNILRLGKRGRWKERKEKEKKEKKGGDSWYSVAHFQAFPNPNEEKRGIVSVIVHLTVWFGGATRLMEIEFTFSLSWKRQT